MEIQMLQGKEANVKNGQDGDRNKKTNTEGPRQTPKQANHQDETHTGRPV